MKRLSIILTALALIAAFPDRAPGFPTPDHLREAAAERQGDVTYSDLPAHLRADLRDGLQALARAVQQALPPDLQLAEGQPDPQDQPVPQSEARHA